MPARNYRGIDTLKNVTRTAVAMERLGKHISAETISRNNRRALFSLRSMPKGYENDNEDRLSQLSSGFGSCQNN
jgi:hypothetical protein